VKKSRVSDTFQSGAICHFLRSERLGKSIRGAFSISLNIPTPHASSILTFYFTELMDKLFFVASVFGELWRAAQSLSKSQRHKG